MKALTWWLRIVGVLYLLEGGLLTLAPLFDASAFAALWASVPTGTLDEIAVRGIRMAGLPGVLTWVLFGVLLMVYSRVPERAGLLVVVVALWELVVWLPTDLVGLASGFEVPRAVTLIAIHLVIGVAGLLLLRRARRVAGLA